MNNNWKLELHKLSLWNKVTRSDIGELSDFIEQELKKEREEIVGMIENQPIEKAHTYGSENAEMYRAYDNGQEQFKKDIINTIKNRT